MVRLLPTALRFMCRVVFGLFVLTLLPAQPLFAQDYWLGEIRWVPYNFAPRGWAFCDGQILPIAQNTALFSLLGTTYGGNGITTFALLDMRARVPLHAGTGAPGLSTRDLGEEGGVESVTLTVAQIAAHTHTLASHTHAIPALAVDVKASSGAATTASPGGNALAVATLEGGGGGRGDGPGAPRLTNIYNASAPDVSLNAGTAATIAGTTGGGSGATMSTGGSTPHDNMQSFLAIHCIIALDGLYPARN